jgi:hypothetical protein
MKYGQSEIPESLFKLARERMLRDDTFTPFDIRTYLSTAGRDEMVALSTIEKNHWLIADRVMRACIDELRDAGKLTQVKRGLWAKTSSLAASGAAGGEPSPDMERLQRARASWERATQGKWSWNCAGEILATIDGQEVVLGCFNGCAADAEAVCRMHNNALALFELAGVSVPVEPEPAAEG